MAAMIAKDIQRCLKNVDSFSNGQAKLVEWDSDNLGQVVVELTLHDGPYKGGKFRFEIKFEDEYPKNAPQVNCITPNVYHPNIDYTDSEYNVCLNLFDEGWQEAFGLEECIQGLLFLMYNPNLEDPVSPYFDGCSCLDYDVFLENVKKSLTAGGLEGCTYEPNVGPLREGCDIELARNAILISDIDRSAARGGGEWLGSEFHIDSDVELWSESESSVESEDLTDSDSASAISSSDSECERCEIRCDNIRPYFLTRETVNMRTVPNGISRHLPSRDNSQPGISKLGQFSFEMLHRNVVVVLKEVAFIVTSSAWSSLYGILAR